MLRGSQHFEIEAFTPKPYYTVVADIAGAAHPFQAVWQPSGASGSALDAEGRLIDIAVATRIVKVTTGQPGSVCRATRVRKKEAPPLPYSLADLQIDAGKALGFAPKRTLDVSQSLYETHRLTTYPRSDCSYLPEGHLSEAPEVIRAIVSVEPGLSEIAAITDLSLRSRAWNDAQVTAHHGLIPTPHSSSKASLTDDERSLYSLIARRYLAQFLPPHEFDQLEANLIVAGERFVARGRHPVAVGWRRVLTGAPNRGQGDTPDQDDSDAADSPIPPLADQQQIQATRTRTVEKKTQPPRRFTSATLVQAMTGISRFVSNPQIKQLLRETDGIGTPATQAQIIQTLFDRKYIEEKKRQIISTSTGRALIRALPDVATQPDMTALWEATLRKIQEGQAGLDGFLGAVQGQLAALVQNARAAGPLQMPGVEQRPCPKGCGGALRRRQSRAGSFWGCSGYPGCEFTEDDVKAAPSHHRRARKRAQ